VLRFETLAALREFERSELRASLDFHAPTFA
jgi:hypothetical protein